jgi:hypothetical protein
MEEKHHGISLKVTDSTNKHVPVSNPGMNHLHGTEISERHKKNIIKKFPHLKNRGVKERRAEMKTDSYLHDSVKSENEKTLHEVAKNYHEHLSKLPTHELAHHIKHILHSHETPMQKQGHNHIRHVTYSKTKGGYGHHSIVPSAHHAHIYNDHHNITTHLSGKSIHFKHKGKTFGRVSVKFSSQSDPLGSIKGSGQTSGD